MTNDEALNILKAAAYDVGDAFTDANGIVRVPVHKDGIAADIEMGRDLWTLAEGRTTLARLAERAGST